MSNEQHSVGEHEVTKTEPPPSAQSDLLDPYKYDLMHVHVKPPMSEQPLGMTLKKLAEGVFSVIGVVEPHMAYLHGVQIGWYLLTCNGKSPINENVQELKPDEKGIRMTFAYRREAPWSTQNPQAFLDKYRTQRRTGTEYKILRVKMTDNKMNQLKLCDEGTEEKRVRVGPDADGQVLNEFGLRVGDTVLGVNEFTVRDRRQCELYLNFGCDLIDLVIERNPNSPPPVATSSTTAAATPSLNSGLQIVDDDEDDTPCKPPSANPAAGVPALVPPDVVQIVEQHHRDHVLANMNRSVRGKRPKGPMNRANGTVSPPGSPNAGPHAKVVNVSAEPLKKPPTDEPDKK